MLDSNFKIHWLVLGLSTVLTVSGCKSPDTSFVEETSNGTDPYCNDIDDWAAEVTLTAAFSDSNDRAQIELGFETRKDVVEMGGQVDVAGADVELILYDKPDLWLVLLPLETAETVTVDGTISCANRNARYLLTLLLNRDEKKIGTDIAFFEGDVDGGMPDQDAGTSD